MKVLWLGDAAVDTGFARCTHAACDALHAAGHEVHVVGINYHGDPHPYPYRIWPARQPLDGARDMFGIARVGRLAARLRPDAVVLLQDPWNVEPYLDSLADRWPEGAGPLPPVVGWIAVDGCNVDGRPLNRLREVVAWTPWSLQELRRGGYKGPGSVVPLGADLEEYRPRDQAEARRRVFGDLPLPEGAFIVTAVGRNQPRKRLDLTIAAFADWIKDRGHDLVYLYLHVAPTREQAVDIGRVARWHGVQSRVMYRQDGVTEAEMPWVYAASDLYLTTTQGEGWGLPALEAMACGVPVVAPAWSGLGSWAAGAARLVGCSATALTAPSHTGAYTVGGVVDQRELVNALDDLYCDHDFRRELSEAGRLTAAQYPWSRSAAGMVAVLERVAGDRQEGAA